MKVVEGARVWKVGGCMVYQIVGFLGEVEIGARGAPAVSCFASAYICLGLGLAVSL